MIEMDNYTKELLLIYEYCFNKYPYPKRYFSKSHITIRSVEIWAYETAISRCTNLLPADPYDVIADFLWELQSQQTSPVCNDATKWRLKHAINVLDDLANFIIKERGTKK